MAGINTLSPATAKYSDIIAGTTDAIFKDFYLPGIRDQLNSKRILARIINRTSDNIVDGQRVVMALNQGRNESSIAIDEAGSLPQPGAQKTGRAEYRMRYVYGRIHLTGQSMSSSRTRRGAFIGALNYEMQGLVRDMQVEDNRRAFGNGLGVLCEVTATASGVDVIQVNNPGGFTNPGPGTQYVRPGMLLGFVNPATGALRDLGGTRGYTVESVQGSAGTITFTATVPNLSVGDLVVRVAKTDVPTTELRSTSYGNEPFGLAAIVNNTNPASSVAWLSEQFTSFLGGIDVADEGTWQSAVVQNQGAATPFSQGMLDTATDAADIIGDSVVRIWLTSHGIRRQYLHELVTNKRYVNTVGVGDGTFKAVEFNGVPMVVDKDCTRGRIYGLDLDSIDMFTETGYYWVDGDNSVLVRDPDREVYSATLARYCQLGTDKRNAHVLIKDIADQ